jgi:hypothetical protein
VVKFTLIVGLSCGGDEKSLLDLFSATEKGVGAQKWHFCSKGGKRELKNLECSINFEAKGRGSNRVNSRVV